MKNIDNEYVYKTLKGVQLHLFKINPKGVLFWLFPVYLCIGSVLIYNSFNYTLMSNTKIAPQNVSVHSRNYELETQIAKLNAQNEYENFQVIHEDTDHEHSQHGFPPQIPNKSGSSFVAGSTTEGKSGFSSRKHLDKLQPQINSLNNQLDSMTILKPDSYDDGNGNYLPLVEQPRQRKKSTNYEQKVDQFHMPQASGIKPNLFMFQDNATPAYQPNESLVIKPRHEQQYNPYSQQARTNKLKNQDARYQNKKEAKEQPQAQELLESSSKKKVKRLPSMNMNDNRGSHLFASHDSSTIILNNTKKKLQQQPQIPENPNHLTDEAVEMQLRTVLQPVDKRSTYTFVREQKFGANYIHPDYRIFSSEGNVQISAKKQYCHLNSYYHITASTFGSELVLANLRGNFGGTEFNLYRMRSGQEELISTIIYESACGSPYRKMEVYVKTANNNDPVFNREAMRRNLKELYNQGHAHILRLITKDPTWNERAKCYSLNLGGKGKFASTKNMVLTPENDSLARTLLFCKSGTDTFHLQVGKPLSLLVAMGILMTSFDFKLLCQ